MKTLKVYITIKNIFIFLYACLGGCFIYFPSSYLYENPDQTPREMVSLFAPYVFVLVIIGTFIYTLNKRL